MPPNDLAGLVTAAATATFFALAVRPGTAKGEQAVSTSTETFACPQAYPGNDQPTARVTSGAMAWGEDRAGFFAGDYSKPAPGGFDETPILADEQAWLICSYGRARSGTREGPLRSLRDQWPHASHCCRALPRVRSRRSRQVRGLVQDGPHQRSGHSNTLSQSR